MAVKEPQTQRADVLAPLVHQAMRYIDPELISPAVPIYEKCCTKSGSDPLEGLHGRKTVRQNLQPTMCVPGMLTTAACPQRLVKATNITNPSNVACLVGVPQCLPL